MKRRYLLVLHNEADGIGLYLMDSDQWSDFQAEKGEVGEPSDAFWGFQWASECPTFEEVTALMAYCERENISIEGEVQGVAY